jgi:CheY-like chemotaxis protein
MAPDCTPLQILVVDDDAEMRSTLRRMLEGRGHRVIECGGGEGVRDAVARGSVQAVILDKEMPGVGGLDVLPALRRAYPDLPVILITAFGGEEVERRARLLGATFYLEKPFRMADLHMLLCDISDGPARTSRPA